MAIVAQATQSNVVHALSPSSTPRIHPTVTEHLPGLPLVSHLSAGPLTHGNCHQCFRSGLFSACLMANAKGLERRSPGRGPSSQPPSRLAKLGLGPVTAARRLENPVLARLFTGFANTSTCGTKHFAAKSVRAPARLSMRTAKYVRAPAWLSGSPRSSCGYRWD